MADPTAPGDKPPAKPAVPAARPAAGGAKPAAGARPAKGKPAAPAEKPAPAPPAEPTMRAEVRARLRKGTPARFEVVPAGTVLGRDSAAGVPIALEGVSREHARIKWDGRGWWVEDLKSTNGTFVNGERVAREKLQHLDVIGLGRKVDLVFVLRSAEAAVATTRQGVVRAALVEDDGSSHDVPVGEVTLGRSAACNVVTEETAVSKVHARVRWF